MGSVRIFAALHPPRSPLHRRRGKRTLALHDVIAADLVAQKASRRRHPTQAKSRA
jgi:hypothetical protein